MRRSTDLSPSAIAPTALDGYTILEEDHKFSRVSLLVQKKAKTNPLSILTFVDDDRYYDWR
jgi:hypothetical protein